MCPVGEKGMLVAYAAWEVSLPTTSWLGRGMQLRAQPFRTVGRVLWERRVRRYAAPSAPCYI